ncbi:MAG: PDZ domain-containing protein [Candidatus Rokuibacteriota bacterium]|nr:MAG: PDZ domain-containing protein [Candidatus Rokubacteria bacterium]
MAAIRSRASGSLAAILTIVALGLTASPGMGQPEPPPSFASIVAAVAPAVVTITAVLEPEPGSGYPDPEDEMAEEDATLGSGVIIDPRGVVVTNAHVAGGARPIEIVTDDGRRFRPTRIAIDRRSDLAVLIIGDGTVTLPHARLADSDRVRVGDWVVAIGTPLGLRTTVTAGIISARVRESAGPGAPDYLQTSAVMHEGSSGGPLVNVHGEVVGINTILAFEAAGLAFTVPSNTVRTVAAQLVSEGRVSRPWLGVLTQALTPALSGALATGTSKGLLVADVASGSPGAAAGLRPGDLLLALDTRQLLAGGDLARALGQTRAGQTVSVRVRRRDGTVHTLAVTLVEERDEIPSSLVTYRIPELGCEVRSVTPNLGVVVIWVNAVAGDGGLRPGDVVRELNHAPVRTVGDLARLADRLRAGDDVALLVQRGPVGTYVALKSRPR